MVDWHETDLDKSARSACREIQQVSEALHTQNQPPKPVREYLLSEQQRDELMMVMMHLTAPEGMNLSLVVQELLELPELEDYCLLSPEEEKECQLNPT